MHGQYLGVPKCRFYLKVVCFFLAFGAFGVTCNTDIRASENRLERWLEQSRAEHDLVALAGLVLQGGKIVEVAATGLRKMGDPTEVTTDDSWHLGSNAKAMTATMVGRLVERGRLAWNDPITDLLPEQVESIHPGYREVTLKHLLTHRSGLPTNFSFFSRFSRSSIDDELPKKRLDAVTNILAKTPLSPPGTAHLYSNVGYTLAGVIAEQATGLSWEELMQQELFMPLGMTSVGFGAPGTAEGLDQPWGHQPLMGITRRSVAPGPWADNDAIMGPAGTVHMSLQDWALFVAEHLRGENGASGLLSADGFQRLHRPALEDYAYGWVVDDDSKLAPGHRLLWHNGSNTMWYTLALLWPERDTAFLFASNVGDIEVAEKAMLKVAKRLVKRYLTP